MAPIAPAPTSPKSNHLLTGGSTLIDERIVDHMAADCGNASSFVIIMMATQ